VSQDAGTGTGELSGPWTDPVGTVREHDDGTTAVKVSMGNETGKGQHVWCEMTPALQVRWLAHDEVAEWATEREARLAALRATIAADPEALFQVGHVHDTSNDMQAFLELPDCTACEGTGKDDHATPFEAPLAVHFAGPPVRAEGRRRQLCMWCGHVLSDVPIAAMERGEWLAFPTGALIRVEDGLSTREPYTDGDELPPACCALPDDEDQAPAEQTATPAPAPWGRCPNTPPCEHPSLIHDVSGDPEDPKPMCCADGCRCGQPAPVCTCTPEWCYVGDDVPNCALASECRLCAWLSPADPCPAREEADEAAALEDGPSDAQETRTAADWPPEPVAQHWDEREPLATDPGDAIDGGDSDEDGDDGA